MTYETNTASARFVEKVSPCPITGCWWWTASTFTNGYGQFQAGGGGTPPVKAHRFAWEQEFGPIPDDLCVCHKCDQKLCVNPQHLFLGTQVENVADRDKKGRTARGDKLRAYPERRARGEGHGMSRLTAELVRQIRAEYVSTPSGGDSSKLRPNSVKGLARKYGLGVTTIGHVLSGRTWKHVK